MTGTVSLRRLRQRFDSEAVDLLRGASLAFVVRLAGAGTTFVFNVLVARRLGVDGTGAFFLALTVLTLAAIIAQVGLSEAVLRFVAANASAEGWLSLRASYRRAVRIVLAAGSLLTFALILVAPLLAVHAFSQPELTGPIRWMALGIVPTALYRASSMALQGLDRAADAGFCNTVIVPLAALAALVVLTQADVTVVVLCYVAASAVAALVAHLRFTALIAGRETGNGPLPASSLMASALPLWWVSICQTFNGWAGFIFVGILASQAEVGLFAAANRSAMLIVFALTAINMIVTPKMASAHQRGDLESLARTTRRGALLSLVAATPTLVLVIVFAGPIMKLFGAGFGAATTLLIILAAGQFFNAIAGSVGYALVMCGFERDLRNMLFVVTALNVALNMLLVPWLGATGAAIAQSVVLVFQNSVATWLVWRRLGFLAAPVPGLPVLRSREASEKTID